MLTSLLRMALMVTGLLLAAYAVAALPSPQDGVCYCADDGVAYQCSMPSPCNSARLNCPGDCGCPGGGDPGRCGTIQRDGQ